MEQRPNFSGRTERIHLNNPKTYWLPDWDGYKDPKKLAMLREIVMQYGRDPRVSELAVRILRENGCKPREYRKQAECLLKWVQTNIYYVNESGERLQSPLYTIKSGMGDCDDMAILLCSFFECIRLSWKFVISGNTRTGLIRYVENDPNFQSIPYSHIYCCVGNRPFTPTEWWFCEPTMNVPLGWDVVKAQHDRHARKFLPELGSPDMGRISTGVGASLADSIMEQGIGKFSVNLGLAIVVGALTAAGTEIMLDYLRASDLYQSLILKKGKKK